MPNSIKCDYYNISFKSTSPSYVFLHIRDVRNGEVYCFYKRLDEENYIFDRSYQEHSGYSIKGYKYNDINMREAIYHDRPANPFEHLKEYKIELKYEQFDIKLENIEEID